MAEQLPIDATGSGEEAEQGEPAADAALAPGEPDLPGPYAVGRWAAGFRNFLRQRPRLRLIGEVVNYSESAKAAYFDLRDADGAVPCSIWRSDLKALDLPEGALKDGVEIVAAGGPDYFPGSQRSSPSFSFRVTYLRPAGEGDLLAQLERLRKELQAEGLFEPQKLLRRPTLPRTVGVVVGSSSAAYADILAALERRSWRGRLVFAHPPVQGRAAAPRIAAAIRELAAVPEVEAIIVSRGGGSLTDLWCFCDEALCRTVANLRVPVISAVGHEVDRTLLDDVAAVVCSTPTHAAEAAVRIDVAAARLELGRSGLGMARAARRQLGARAGGLGRLARALAGQMRSERARLHQRLREIRAASRRTLSGRRSELARFPLVLRRRREAELHDARSGDLHKRIATLAAVLSAHDPDRVLERGYAVVSDPGGGVVSSAAAARAAGQIDVRFADDHVEAEVIDHD